MTTAPTADGVEAAARALLDDRMTAVRALADTRAGLTRAREAVVDAERADAAAYAAAQRAGWTDTELKRLGLEAPARRSPGRPRSPRPTPADA